MSASSLLRSLLASLVVTALGLTGSLAAQARDEKPRDPRARAMLTVLEADRDAGQPWVELNQGVRLPRPDDSSNVRLLSGLLPSVQHVRDELQRTVVRMEAIDVDPRKTSVLFQNLYARHVDAWRAKAEAWSAWADALKRALSEARAGAIDERALEIAEKRLRERDSAADRAILGSYDVLILAAKEAGVDTRAFEVRDEDAESARPAVSSAPRSDPKQGIADASIEAVYLKRTTTLGARNVPSTALTPFLFLEDGTFFENFRTAPADTDAERLRREEPKRQGRWTRQADELALQGGDGKSDRIAIAENGRVRTDESRDWYSTVPAIDAEPLEGSFSQTGGATPSEYDGIVFSKDGTYVREGSAGTYRVDGFTLELRSESGRTERALFFFCVDSKGEKDPGAIGIDGQIYTRDKD